MIYQKSNFLVILLIFLGLSNYMCLSAPRICDDLNYSISFPSASPSSLFDSVELFVPPQDSLIISVNFKKNFTYYFYVESYAPFAEDFSIDIYCTTPAARQYHFFDYTADITNNASIVYFEFGATETGNHSIHFDISTASNINLHIFLEEYLPIDLYYAKFTYDMINKDILYFSSIDRFGTNQLSQTYTFPLQEDTEYYFNFFRVNPISLSDIEANGFINPLVAMDVILNQTTYTFYPTVPTLEYALYSNIDNLTHDVDPNQRDLYNDTFLIRFGAHVSDNATVTITLSEHSGFDLNFAFVAYGIGEIGDGPDNSTELQNGLETNVTIPNEVLNPNGTDLMDFNPTLDDQITGWLSVVEMFVDDQFWILIPSIIGIAGIMYGMTHFIPKDKVKKQNIPDSREIPEA